MTVAVNQVQKDNTDAQLLAAALNAAVSVYGVKMTEKQKEAAAKLETDKEKLKADRETEEKRLTAQKDWINVPGDYKGPGVSAIKLPGEAEPVLRVPTSVYTEHMKGENEIKKAQIAAASKAENKPEKHPGQDALDKAFAKEYSDYVTSGGSSSMASNLAQLREISGALSGIDPVTGQPVQKIDSATGGLTSILPKAARDYVSPDSAALQDRLEKVVQGSMKQVLGAQFTEKEGKNVLERAFNIRQSPEENAKRVNQLFNELAAAAQAKQAAIDYYEQNGTLKGFKGKVSNINDFGGTQTANQAPSAGTAIAAPAKMDAQIDQYAKSHGLTYDKAKAILVNRGYKPNE